MTHLLPSWFEFIRLLLGVARRRTQGRMRAAAARRRGGVRGLGYGFALFMNLLLQVVIAVIFLWLSSIANVVAIEHAGRLVVSDNAYSVMQAALPAAVDAGSSNNGTTVADNVDRNVDAALHREAHERHHDRGGDEDAWYHGLTRQYAERHIGGFVADAATKTPNSLIFRVLAALLVIWWLSLVLQGEGMNFDSMRRRHPMWEWYLGFPIPQTAVFVAEALAPAVSNPFLLMSPVMIAVLVGVVSKSILVGLFALPIGIPLLLAATLWAKALEVLIMLRSSMRNRSAWFFLLATAGYIALIAPIVFVQAHSLVYMLAAAVAPWIDAMPSARVLLDTGNPLGWLSAMAASAAIGLLLSIPAVLVMRFATTRGLESGFGSADAAVDAGSFQLRLPGRWGWLKDPLLRKERLWLKRDRGALLQLIGVPLILLAGQFFNFHNITRSVDWSWNKLAGLIFFLGAMLLAAAGPRTLISEGPALLLTMSWPRSLEDILRMKVRVLFVLVTVMIWACLGVVIWVYPGDALKLIGVALLWPLFGLSVAEKAVTLIRAPSQSGEPEPIPRGQVSSAALGNSTFALAVFTAQWQLAFAAIAMNWVFAGALWQSFRLRLAYLFDPESEPQLRPPTILSSLLAIVGLLEIGAIITAAFLQALGKEAAPFARVMGYGIAAVGVCIAVVNWQKGRGVSFSEMLTLDIGARFVRVRQIFVAVACGGALAIVGIGYQQVLLHAPWPQLHEFITKSSQFFADSPNARVAYAIMAVGIAPWVEEFLFRGLMFRAMLPEWGLVRATIASAAFFAVLHPWPAWPMVFMLGAGNALLYARTRSLLPCILLHAAYNAVLIYFSS